MKVSLTDELDLKKIAESGQCFRWDIIDEKGTVRIPYGPHLLYAVELGPGEFDFSCDEDIFDKVWRMYFDLDTDYGRIRSLIDREKDPFLWEAAQHGKGLRILRQDPWEALVSFIISQNRNIPAIKRSIELLCGMCGEKKTDSRGEDYYMFPSPGAVSALSEKELTDCRLGYRVKYVKAAAESVASGEFVLEDIIDADDDTAMKALTSLYGVGEKVANCVLLFGLHHINAFPRDVWIKRVLEEHYGEGYPFEEYSPYNGVYQQYMFEYYRK